MTSLFSFSAQFTSATTIEDAGLRIVSRQNLKGNGNDLGIDNICLFGLECDIDVDGKVNYLGVDTNGSGVFDAIEAGLDPRVWVLIIMEL